MRTRDVCIALALISASACGGGGSTNPPPPSGNTPPPAGGISIQNNSFSPSTRTITAGSSVTWSWNSCTSSGDPYGGGGGETCIQHGVNFDDGISSPTQEKGSYVRTFNAAGVYNYHCAIHGAAMAGSVTVQ